MKPIYIILLLFMSNFSFSQADDISIQLKKIEDIEAKGPGILPVYEIVKSNKLYYRGRKYKIKLPNPSALNGIAFVYYRGNSLLKIPDSVPLLIEDYKSENPKFYLDLNNNLDFTDDNPRDYEKGKLKINGKEYSFLSLSIPPSLSESTTYSVRVVSLEKKMATHLNFFKDQISVGRHEKVADTEYWFGSFRLNNVRGIFKWADSTYQITVEDTNCNGIFGEKGDLFFTKSINSEKKMDSWEIGEGRIFELGQQQFLLKNIHSSGNSMTIQVNESSSKLRLRKGDNIKGLTLNMVDNRSESIEKFMDDKKYTVLYFWGTWCAPCRERLPKLVKLHESYNDKLNVIGFAYKDKPKRLKKYIQENNIEWTNAVANDEFVQKFNVDSYPTYLLVAPNGVILGVRRLKDIEKEINKK
jgi:thiol-disulfide isomerase/thioredoxin